MTVAPKAASSGCSAPCSATTRLAFSAKVTAGCSRAVGQQPDLFLGEHRAGQRLQSLGNLGGRRGQIAGVQGLLGQARVQGPDEPGVVRGLPQHRRQVRSALAVAPADGQLQLQELKIAGELRRRFGQQLSQQPVRFRPSAAGDERARGVVADPGGHGRRGAHGGDRVAARYRDVDRFGQPTGLV
jgi:hypothetical protein